MLNQLREQMLGYQIKKLKSIETHHGIYWSCSVFKDGVQVADVTDTGNGAMIQLRYYGVGLENMFIKDAAIALPDNDFEREGNFVALLADNHELITKITRKCKTATLFQFDEDVAEGAYRILNAPFTALLADRTRDIYGAKLNCILNEQV